MSTPHIAIILATAREGRQSAHVARYVERILADRDDVAVSHHDVRDYIHGRTIAPWEESDLTQDWRDVVKSSDGFLIVTPEYNHSYPGELKMLLDQELAQYLGKPVGVCGVSAGRLGGARVVEQLLPVFNELGLVHVPFPVYFGNVKKLFDDDGRITDDAFATRVNTLCDMLVIYEQHLRGLADAVNAAKK